MGLDQAIKRLNAIADAGLTYGDSVFDLERYQEIKEVLSQFTAEVTNLTSAELSDVFRPTEHYPTPMIDVRAFVKNEKGEILLVRDQAKGDWTLPGGYGEIGLTPSENVLKELHEEAGVIGQVQRLLAVFDTEKWQPQGRQYYKFVFECQMLSRHFVANSETSEIGFFDLGSLAVPLSEKRITLSQLRLLDDLSRTGQQHID
jgi:ADP-ribose pyrophosphatase YjhB (NUDIX family)